MKIKLSKNQWEEMGKKSGWLKQAQDNTPNDPEDRERKIQQRAKNQLGEISQQLVKLQDYFRSVTAILPTERWDLIGKDCDAVVQHLDNAAGRISTIISRVR